MKLILSCLTAILIALTASPVTADSLLGMVTSTQAGNPPIVGAVVRTLGEDSYSTTTSTDGSYVVDIPAGEFTILVSAAGHIPQRIPVTIPAGSAATVNFTLRPASTGNELTLPAPLDWGEAPGADAPPGDSFSISFTDMSTLPSPGTPRIGGWNETVKPDESFTLTGGDFTTRAGDEAGTDTTVWVYTGGSLRQAKVWKVTGETLTATMPDDVPYGMYLVWVENSIGAGPPICINRVRTTHIGPTGNTGYPGARMRVFGRNISHNRGTSPSDTYVYIQPASGGELIACTVTRADPYNAEFIIPTGIANGDYKLFVHNGHGGVYGWSDALDLVIQDQWVRGATQINLSPSHVDDTTDIQSAINVLTSYPNGGTVNLSAGTFILTNYLQLKDNVEIKGAGMDATKISVQLPASVISPFRLMGNRIALTDLTIHEAAGCNPSGFPGIITNTYANTSYNRFSNIRVMGTTSVSLAASGYVRLGKLSEAADCIFYAPVGTNGESWVHNCTIYGGRFGDGWEAALSLMSRRDVIEYNHVETPVWPYVAGSAHPYNYDVGGKGTPPSAPNPPDLYDYAWNIRFALTYCSEMYMAYNTADRLFHSRDLNKGEMILFHGYPGTWFGNVLSASGKTMTVRTDGMVDDQVMTINNYGWTMTGGGPIPDVARHGGPIDNRGNFGVMILRGRGVGQRRNIVSHTSNTITVDKPWFVQPDSTSVAMISVQWVDDTVYKNTLTGFHPEFYPDYMTASIAVQVDGNAWGVSLEGNTSRRTIGGRRVSAYSGSMSCWNELRDEKAYDLTAIWQPGVYVGTVELNPAGIGSVGNAIRGGDVSIVGSPSSASGTGEGIRSNRIVGGIIEKVNITAKGGIDMMPLSDLPYGSVLARKCSINAFNNTRLSPGTPGGMIIENFDDDQFLSYNSYMGATHRYLDLASQPVSPYQVPVPLNKCARFKGYIGGHIDPSIIPIANAGTGAMTWSVSASDPWITAVVGTSPTVAAEVDTGRLIVDVDTTGMEAGKHWGYVTLATGAKTVKVGVCVDLQSGTPAHYPPIASFTATPPGGIAPIDVVFDASGSTDPDGTIVSYSWDFGDGTVASGVTASHTYSTPGVYLVSLTVTDNSGRTSMAAIAVAPGVPMTGVSISGNPAPPAEPGTAVTLTAVPTGGYNVKYKFLLKSETNWSTLREYGASPTIEWSVPSTPGYYAIRVLARSEGSAGAYDAIAEISYPVGVIPTEGLKLWLLGDTGIALDEHGKVTSWADQSGAGNNLSQGVSAKRPLLATGSIDGKPAVRFAGPSQLMQTAGLVLSGNTSFTSFTVARPTTVTPNAFHYIWWNGVNTNTGGYGTYISNTSRLRAAWGNQSYYLTDTSSAASGQLYRISTRYTPGNHQGWINGVSIGSGAKTGSNFSSGAFYVGNQSATSTEGFYGDIGEIIIYNRALSDTERLAVENYLNTKWSPIPTVTVDRLTDVKALSDQTKVSITTPKAVTVQSGIFKDNVYYISEPDRTAGLKVVGEETVSLWENITLTGTVGTDFNGEKMLVVDTIDTRVSGEEFSPLGMLNKVVTPSGQLVRVWGRVTEVGDGYFIVNDGSGSPVVIDTASLVTPITVTIQTGQYVAATGLAGKGDGGIRVVRPRSDMDIQTH